jgi:tetratricopeptide (TPR) repeat protein
MRASSLLDSDPAAAALKASAVLAEHPQHEGASLLFAAARRRLGDLASATSMIESLAAAHPNSAVMQLEVGRTHAAAGRTAAAIAALEGAVALDPQLADGWRELAAQHFAAGDTLRGDTSYAAYSRLVREPPELTDALVALSANRLDAADTLVRRELRQSPRNPAALRLLAGIADRRGDRFEAERCFRETLELAPGDSAAREELARLLHGQERVAESLPLIERLLAADPDNARFWLLKAQSLRLVGRSDEAVALVQKLLAKQPDAEAYGDAYWALADLKTYRFAAADLAAMRADLAQAPSPPKRGESDSLEGLEFALGKALEDEHQFAAAFEHYQRANSRHRAANDYDAEATTIFTGRSNTVFSAPFFAARAGWGSARRDPIFIIGMPRSGSTLLEQILASHPEVEGTRELPDIPNMVRNLAARTTADDPAEYPERVALLPREEIQALAERYLARVQEHRPRGLPRFVDKMLGNFSHVGLIQLMFPNATIIEARRHPLACTFSCYKQRFARGMNFSYDMSELGHYYRNYADAMAHLEAALPGRLYRVHYEQLIADPEAQVRRLLAHCGLPFDSACLRFYENRRIVLTISSEQVRMPLYSESVDQWRHFEPWLQPLRDALGDLPNRYPSP